MIYYHTREQVDERLSVNQNLTDLVRIGAKVDADLI